MTPLEPFAVITPLGPASCTGVISDVEDPQWCCWINSTLEVWWFDNRHMRIRRNVTNTMMSVSPFSFINAPLQKQIERYIANGWLPKDYDPTNVDTWKL